MLEPPLPPDEDQRLAALRSLKILDTPPEERFDRITRIATRLFDVPIALVSLIDANRQWFKSCQGLTVSETPRAISFCGHAILGDDVFVVPDARLDPRFSDNPLVTDQPYIRFYAGCPLTGPNGSKLGTLCLVDRRPRQMSALDLKAMKDLAIWAQNELNAVELNRAFTISENLLKMIFETTPECIKLVAADGSLLNMNPAGLAMIEADSLNQVVGRSVYPLVVPENRPAFKKLTEDVFRGKSGRLEYEIVGLKGTRRWLETQVVPFRNGQGGITAVLGVTRDITDRRQSEQTIHRMVFYDALTNLPNRNMVYDRLLNAIRTDGGEGKPIALLLMDLDRFKEVNDTLGHHRGDVLLQQVGVRLKGALRPSDMVARLGGDEFAVVLPLASAKDAVLVADKILKALEPPFVIEGQPIAMEASIGLALYPDHGGDPDSLMQRADVAMYAAKQSGSGYILYDVRLDRHSLRGLALMGELRQAIEHDQLFLHYQPSISFKTHRIISAEVLVRWQHPQHGLVPPDQFILPSEKTGLIHPLTRWVLGAALRQCQAWQQAGIEIPSSVNLSARNLHDPHFPEQLAELLMTSGIGPERLELEITESAIMVDPGRALDAITRLRALGIRFAIDDFGVGYSSLGYLKKLPVDAVKIDKSFVIGMAVSADNAVIVRSTVDLAHNLGLRVVAEGVEDKASYDRLAELGCDAAQGYYMCKPIPADELTRWLKESPWGIIAE